ncbi:hypothetical protein EIP91_002186 [Steccherinum ochraceum]|uniref:Uncharacterized protein n=1 Tax=Steccherinum ochraceum TaxID=92696 RepID=A0A4R0RGD1_9APHY|nr:hypothetical protein EIP91_002186 [Steccherinum ochraceum]
MSSQPRRASTSHPLFKDDITVWCDHPDFDKLLQETISKDETMNKLLLQQEMDEWFRLVFIVVAQRAVESDAAPPQKHSRRQSILCRNSEGSATEEEAVVDSQYPILKHREIIIIQYHFTPNSDT